MYALSIPSSVQPKKPYPYAVIIKRTESLLFCRECKVVKVHNPRNHSLNHEHGCFALTKKNKKK